MGMVFQYYAIWPHMTVYQNVAFGLEVLKRSKNETKERAARILDIVGLKGLERRYPGQLSGGKLQQYGPRGISTSGPPTEWWPTSWGW